VAAHRQVAITGHLAAGRLEPRGDLAELRDQALVCAALGLRVLVARVQRGQVLRQVVGQRIDHPPGRERQR
jgi:hypothetical protein